MPSTHLRAHRRTRAPRAVPHPAPAGGTVAEDTLWAALYAHPASTASDLAPHAGIGYSTAGKILTTWARDGSVTRTTRPAQAGRRAADTWVITDTTGDTGTEEITTSDPGAAEQPTTSATPTGTDATVPDAPATPRQRTRLGRGALRGMVEDYLTEHPSQQVSPSTIGTALQRSSGAVANALNKLVTDGYTAQTCDKPKRFTAAKIIPEPAILN